MTSRGSRLGVPSVRFLPGIALCTVISAIAYGVQGVEVKLIG